MYLLFLNKRITCDLISIQIFPVHVYCTDLMIVVCGVIINSFLCVAAGSVKGNLIFSFFYFTTSSLLIHTAQNVKELTDTFHFRFSGHGMHFGIGHTDKTGLGRKISRQAQSPHSAAI